MNPPAPDLHEMLDTIYAAYTRREYVHPDPLEFLYNYPVLPDREVVGLIAACLAFGNVRQILRSVCTVLRPMGASPRAFIAGASARELGEAFEGFKHRWVTGADIAALLEGVQAVLDAYGSVEACYCAHRRLEAPHATGLAGLVHCLARDRTGHNNYLLPAPERGSACKRLHLYLRWMTRQDAVDPGGWHNVPPADLVVPLDVHMHRIGRRLGLLRRKQADGRAALELTAAFRRYAPGDPVRYDFALTRLGIHPELSLECLPMLARD